MRLCGALVLARAQALPTAAAAQQEPPTEATVIAAYVDNVILPTYGQLERQLPVLHNAIVELRTAPTDANLERARFAWRSARQPWEWGESFLFGPVSSMGFDPILDTWPISRDDLDALLRGSTPLDRAAISQLEPDVKGFHALELILFGDRAAKRATDLTPRELDYAELVSAEMQEIAQTLRSAWTIGGNDQGAFRNVLTSAGPDNLVYDSPTTVVAELLDGISGILNEVAEEKIGLPLASRDPELAESRFSETSIDDYRDNIRGAYQSYTGGVPGLTPALSLQALVRSRNPALDSEITDGFNRVFAALDAIPVPFEQSIVEVATSGPARAARNVSADLADLVDGEVSALLIGERPETGESPALALARTATAIDDATRALNAGDLPGAIASYTRFDDGWADIEDGVRAKSRDNYREIEGGIGDVRATLLKPAQPEQAAASAALARLRQLINAALPALR
jgi:predicted lipoprotein